MPQTPYGGVEYNTNGDLLNGVAGANSSASVTNAAVQSRPSTPDAFETMRRSTQEWTDRMKSVAERRAGRNKAGGAVPSNNPPAQAPQFAPPPGGGIQAPPPAQPAFHPGGGMQAPTPDQKQTNKIEALAPGSGERLWAKAKSWSSTPGYEWLNSHPEVIAMYEANPQGQNFQEWTARNWEGIVQKTGMTQQSSETFGGAARTAGYDKWAQRLRDQKGPGGEDTSWITPEHTRKYDEWSRMAAANGVAPLDFYTWAGSVNAPQAGGGAPAPGGAPPPDGGVYGHGVQRRIAPTPELQAIWDKAGHGAAELSLRAVPAASPNGGASSSMSGTMTQGAGLGQSDEYLKQLQDAIRKQHQQGMREGERGLRAGAALSGVSNSGAFLGGLSDFYGKSGVALGTALAEPMFTASESERERISRQLMAQIQAEAASAAAGMGAEASRYGADASLKASMYNADRDFWAQLSGQGVQRDLGMANVGLGYFGNQLDYDKAMGNLGLGYYQTDQDMIRAMLSQFGGADPAQGMAAILGSLPGYTPPVQVTNKP